MIRRVLWFLPILATVLLGVTVVFVQRDLIRVRYHGRQLTQADGEWVESYRRLVLLGEPGWAELCSREFAQDGANAHLQAGADLGGLDDELVVDFERYWDQELELRLEDEVWAEAYARRQVAAMHGEGRYLIPTLAGELRERRARPDRARLTIALLRAALDTRQGYPWHGSADDQRSAMDRWLTLVPQKS